MKRAIALMLATALATGSCEFAQKHPAITAGIAGGSVGFLGCEIDSVKHSTCAAIGGSTALFLGGIAALALLIFGEPEDTMAMPEDEEMTSGGAVRVHTHTAPPPVVIDAGVAAMDGGAAPTLAPSDGGAAPTLAPVDAGAAQLVAPDATR